MLGREGCGVRKKPWLATLSFILLTEAVGGLSALLSGGMELYESGIQKPPLSPPGIVFPIVWTILFALLGIGAARIYLAPDSPERTKALTLYLVQLAVNFFWSILFFRFEAFGFALLWLILLWILILWMADAFAQVDKWASALQIPYILWVAFAGYLNFGVWRLN